MMNGHSSLPPLKKNDGKLGLLALLLLLGAGGLWFLSRDDGSSEPVPETVDSPTEEAAPREQFAAEIEIPEDEALPDPEPTDAAPDEPSAPDEPRTDGSTGQSINPFDWECNGRINPAAVRAVIKGAPSKQVQTCYERGLKGNNLLQGSMQVELVIGASGAVRAVDVSGTLRDRQVYSCVKRVARTWRFPAPEGGCVRINAPFQMTPKL
jgi:hypothetical protein